MVKAKGFPKNNAFEKSITFELMKEQVNMLLRNESPVSKVIEFDAIRSDKYHNLYNCRISKQFSLTFMKRIVCPDGSTLPIGTVLK